MRKYEYKYKNAKGEIKTGVTWAKNKADAIRHTTLFADVTVYKSTFKWAD